MRAMTVALIALSAVAACSGPKQKGGAEEDKAMATASGVPYSGTGPNERIGKAQDEVDRATAKARAAQASALKQQGREIKPMPT